MSSKARVINFQKVTIIIFAKNVENDLNLKIARRALTLSNDHRNQTKNLQSLTSSSPYTPPKPIKRFHFRIRSFKCRLAASSSVEGLQQGYHFRRPDPGIRLGSGAGNISSHSSGKTPQKVNNKVCCVRCTALYSQNNDYHTLLVLVIRPNFYWRCTCNIMQCTCNLLAGSHWFRKDHEAEMSQSERIDATFADRNSIIPKI